MRAFELDYYMLVEEVLANGEHRATRNADTIAVFGTSLTADLTTDGFPILAGRKLFPKGILGELAAMLRRPTCKEDFEKWGCNYWDLWSDEQGKLKLDYGNAWFDFNGFNQIREMKRLIKSDPTNRRIMINSWRPDRLAELSLPCCHYSYQFFIAENRQLNMVWTQRSVDVMIGLPSDLVFAAAWLIAIANEFHLTPGKIKMDFGDTHIYADHIDGARQYQRQAMDLDMGIVDYEFNVNPGKDFCDFEPQDLILNNYTPQPSISFKLHG